MTLTDTDSMPFGQHAGLRMEEVPANYLLFLWNDGLHNQAATESSGNKARIAVRNYIKDALGALMQEAPDIIVKNR